MHPRIYPGRGAPYRKLMNLYHVTRRDGTPLFVHPFIVPGSTLNIDSATELYGRYGSEPRVESLTLLRNELYRRIDADVRTWIGEQRFIPRFLISAAAFLLSFLFMSLVIRDPVPVVDELLISGAIATVVFLVVGKRFVQSEPAGKRRIMLRSKVDGIVFTESPFVRELETILHRMEGYDLTSFMDKGKNSDEKDQLVGELRRMRENFPDDMAQLTASLREMTGQRPYKKLHRQLKRGYLTGKTEEMVEQGVLVPAVVVLLVTMQKS